MSYVLESIDAVATDMEAAGHAQVMEVRSFGLEGDGRGVYFDTVDAIG
jgi:hypothetical protein